jgi:hypothetical protein
MRLLCLIFFSCLLLLVVVAMFFSSRTPILFSASSVTHPQKQERDVGVDKEKSIDNFFENLKPTVKSMSQ